MCYHFRFLCVLCCLALGLSSRSAIVVDTIYSPQRDRVIVTYDVNIADGHATIKFLDAKRKLTSSKYSQVSDIKAIFFDKLGGYADKVKFTGQAQWRKAYASNSCLPGTLFAPQEDDHLQGPHPVRPIVHQAVQEAGQETRQQRIISCCGKQPFLLEQRVTNLYRNRHYRGNR